LLVPILCDVLPLFVTPRWGLGATPKPAAVKKVLDSGARLGLYEPRDEHSSEQRQQNDFKASHASSPGGTPPNLARVGPHSARL